MCARRGKTERDYHHGLDHDSDDGLKAQGDGGLGAVFGDVARPVSDRVLRLQAEEEAGGEVADGDDAGLPILVLLSFRLHVAVRERDAPPHDPKHQPAAIARSFGLESEKYTHNVTDRASIDRIEHLSIRVDELLY